MGQTNGYRYETNSRCQGPEIKGKRNGLWICRDLNKRIISETTYRNDTVEGPFKYYHLQPNDQMRSGIYKNGELTCSYTMSNAGDTLYTYHYVTPKESIYSRYDSTGIIEQGTFVDDLYAGDWYFYYKYPGKKMAWCKYENGYPVRAEYYYPSGKLCCEKIFKAGKQVSESYRSETGDVIPTCNSPNCLFVLLHNFKGTTQIFGY